MKQINYKDAYSSVMIANKMLEQEIERMENLNNQLVDECQKLDDEVTKLQNIIKEVREYIMIELITEWDIKNDGYVSGSDLPADAITPILDILDKENENGEE